MEILNNISLANHTTFRIGGKADYFIEIKSKADIKDAYNFIKKQKIPFVLIGGGSNILFSDAGFKGAVIKMQNNDLEFYKNEIKVHAGVNLQKLVLDSANNGLALFSLAGIPGTVGGAIAGNAGARNGVIGCYLKSAEIFDFEKGEFFNADYNFFEFNYRQSVIQKNKNFVIYSAILNAGRISNSESILKKIKQINKERSKKQPKGFTAGSFFKNPLKKIAGKLLEEADCKGIKIGDAMISQIHANWIINLGNATQEDVINLAKIAKKKAFEKFQIILQPEVKIINENGYQIRI